MEHSPAFNSTFTTSCFDLMAAMSSSEILLPLTSSSLPSSFIEVDVTTGKPASWEPAKNCIAPFSKSTSSNATHMLNPVEGVKGHNVPSWCHVTVSAARVELASPYLQMKWQPQHTTSSPRRSLAYATKRG